MVDGDISSRGEAESLAGKPSGKHAINGLRLMVERDIERSGRFSSFMIRSGMLVDLLDELAEYRRGAAE